MYKKKPFFIIFEGVEGCGKSFQSKKLFRKLKKKNIDTILTREPGGTKSSELIRNVTSETERFSIGFINHSLEFLIDLMIIFHHF